MYIILCGGTNTNFASYRKFLYVTLLWKCRLNRTYITYLVGLSVRCRPRRDVCAKEINLHVILDC